MSGLVVMCKFLSILSPALDPSFHSYNYRALTEHSITKAASLDPMNTPWPNNHMSAASLYSPSAMTKHTKPGQHLTMSRLS